MKGNYLKALAFLAACAVMCYVTYILVVLPL